MVSDEFLDDIAREIDLAKLDKLCRELGEKEKDVKNLKIQFSTYNIEHTEQAFKIFFEIRKRKGVAMTFKVVIGALWRSNNRDIIDALITKHDLR